MAVAHRLPEPRRARLSAVPAPPAALLTLGLLALVGSARAEPVGELALRDTGLGSEVHVPAGARSEQDLLAIRADVTVEGEAAGDVVAIDGDVIVRGRVGGDALAIRGRVRVERGGEVHGNAFSLFGGVDAAPGSIAGRTRSLAPMAPGDRPGYLALVHSKPVLVLRFLGLVFWLLAALIATLVAPRVVAQAASEVHHHPLRLAGIGVLITLSLALLLVLAVALVPIFVGIPLLVLLVLACIGLKAVALAASFHAVGERVAERLRAGAITGYVEVLTGALIFGLLCFVPVVGELAWLFAYLAGAGGAVATRMRRREPHRLGRAA